jgi:hypothetical protein
MTTRQRSIAPRDQAPSAFASVLMRLGESVDAVAAALVDAEGETVDYAATIEPFEVKVAAAELSILIGLLRSSAVPHWPETEELFMRGTRRTLYARALQADYALVLILPRRAFYISPRAVGEALRDLSREAGIDLPASVERQDPWCRVEVRTKAGSRRPESVWLDGSWRDLEVLGHFRADPARREVGYRARLPSGAELNLVREPFNRWYADTPHLST